MRPTRYLFLALALHASVAPSAAQADLPGDDLYETLGPDTFQWEADQFADVRVLRYRIPGWEQLSLQQKTLAYYLTQAGLSGRDIFWDQNYRYNLRIRRALERLLGKYHGDRNAAPWPEFLLYAKRVFFSNGIHHHYGNEKFVPGFDRKWFEAALAEVGYPLAPEVLDAMFDPAIDAKKVSLDPGKDLLLSSAVNFYGKGITEKEATAFYAAMEKKDDPRPLSHGINSKLVRGKDGQLREEVWRVGGMYGAALGETVKWLEKAITVAENDQQKKVLGLLIEFFRTGDLAKWDEFNVEWVKETAGTVDLILGFVEVYNDPLGKRGSFESCVEVNDPEATRNMSVISANAQWFEDHSPILPQHKRNEVKGITYRFVNTAGESGDSAPTTPVGVNLPNANWIRAEFGSKSVSLGNISEAYDKSSGSATLELFCNDQEEVDRAKQFGPLAGMLHTALHEVIGHASGRLEEGVGETDATLKNYASTLEEGRADLVALYYLMDPKLVDLGVMPSLEVGKAEYDSYIRNGLLVQLRRIKLGDDIEEAHMRNRHWVSEWVFEKGTAEGVIQKHLRDGATYYDIQDYGKLRDLFGQLLREVQRIKSQGDYEAGKALVENFGVKIDRSLHTEVLERAKKITTAPYAGFIQPELVPVTDANGTITDVKVTYPKDFLSQMLVYGQKYGFLPDEN